MRLAGEATAPDLVVQSVTAPSVECIPFHCSFPLFMCSKFNKDFSIRFFDPIACTDRIFSNLLHHEAIKAPFSNRADNFLQKIYRCARGQSGLKLRL
jgi:hypothetical protein